MVADVEEHASSGLGCEQVPAARCSTGVWLAADKWASILRYKPRLSSRPPSSPPRHPFCMAIGFVFFMGEGLISAWAIRTTAGEERVRGLEMHAIMQVGTAHR